MLRPYITHQTGRHLPQLVPRVLLQHRVGVDLRLRDRHQHEVVRPGCLELPGLRVLAKPDQVLSPLRFERQLEQPFAQDDVWGDDGTERVPPREGTSAHGLQQREGTRSPRRPVELRLGLDQVDLGEAEVREIVADRKSTRLNSSHLVISYAVFCLKKKKKEN